MKKPFRSAAAALALLLAAPAAAQPGESTVHRHLGVLVRPYLALGYLSGNVPGTGGDVSVSGFAGQLGVVVGGAIVENLILGGEFYVNIVDSPSASRNGQSLSLNDTSFGDMGIGPNLTYYFMPVNIYVSVTPALTQVTLSEANYSYNSDWGFGVHAAVGKEWWISDHWGLGIGGQFTWSTNSPGKGIAGSTVNTWGAGGVFSATYN